MHKQIDLHTRETCLDAYSRATDTTKWDVAQDFFIAFLQWLNPYENDMFNQFA